jgi:hypothetical protein
MRILCSPNEDFGRIDKIEIQIIVEFIDILVNGS